MDRFGAKNESARAASTKKGFAVVPNCGLLVLVARTGPTWARLGRKESARSASDCGQITPRGSDSPRSTSVRFTCVNRPERSDEANLCEQYHRKEPHSVDRVAIEHRWRTNQVMALVNAEKIPANSLVSVIIATFNRSNVLKIALQTLRWQTYEHWEAWVIGDCCTDDTEAVVASFNDDRIHFYNLPENFGEQSGPNNEGVSPHSRCQRMGVQSRSHLIQLLSSILGERTASVTSTDRF